jgi:hypothetical protein
MPRCRAQSIEEDLRRALERREFTLRYQPKVNLGTGAITGAEALTRWNHPTRGSVSPAQFIPVAEDSGLIVPIGDWVLREACAQAQRWTDEGLPAITIAASISAMQFSRAGFLEGVYSALSEADLDPRRLELELTESALLTRAELTESTSKALDQWAYQNKVILHFIQPDRPMQNGYIESFHGKFREECLNQHWFLTLDDARETIETWRIDYNQVRPHSALGYLTPEEFATGHLRARRSRPFRLQRRPGAAVSEDDVRPEPRPHKGGRPGIYAREGWASRRSVHRHHHHLQRPRGRTDRRSPRGQLRRTPELGSPKRWGQGLHHRS